jgi:pimeloyl-ACP methyl ester carboxylesterase
LAYIRKTVHVGGSNISVIDAGSGPAVILGHGFLCDADYWAPQIDALVSHYRVIVPELWGHGESGALPADIVSIRDVACHYLDLLDALEVDRCTIVGLSMGGMWGAELALMAPERVTGLVLMDTSLAAEPAASYGAFIGLLGAIEQSRGFPEPVLNAVPPLFFSPTVDDRDPTLRPAFAARLRAWDPERVVDSLVPLGRIIFDRREALADLAALTMPTLVTTGVDDQARSPAEGRAMAEQIGCTFVEIPQAGHTASLEAPDFVNRLLIDFLASQSSSGPR